QTSTNRTYRFGRFELHVRSRELRKDGTRLRLPDQPFELLTLLLEKPGEVLLRDELRQRLWPDGTFVDFEHGLNAAMKRLRAVLGDDPEQPQFIETVPRRGYQFIGVVEQLDHSGSVANRPRQVRLAVLPLTSRADNGTNDYFAEGLREEII